MSMQELDRRLLYLSGEVLYVDKVPIYPISLRNISKMGYSRCMTLLHCICCDIDDLIDNTQEQFPLDYVFPLLILQFKQDERMKDLIFSAISMICRTEQIKFDFDTETFCIGDGELNQSNFLQFQEIVKERNGINKVGEASENPADARTAALLAKKRSLHKKLEQSKKAENGGVELDDLISIVAVGLHLPLETVYSYDLFQLKNQFERLKVFKDYDVNIEALLAGAEKVDIQHWVSSLRKESNE